jgi:hypothetical protein
MIAAPMAATRTPQLAAAQNDVRIARARRLAEEGPETCGAARHKAPRGQTNICHSRVCRRGARVRLVAPSGRSAAGDARHAP